MRDKIECKKTITKRKKIAEERKRVTELVFSFAGY